MVVGPIVVFEDRDLCVYESVEELARHLEAPEIIEGRYDAFDVEGKRLVLEMQGKRVGVVEAEGGERKSSELEARLREYLREVNDLRAEQGVHDLRELVKMCAEHSKA